MNATLPATSTPPCNPVLHLNGVTKSYGGLNVLAGVSLTVNPGDRLVICGPSGSGKSTLIRTINGLASFEQGTIDVYGERMGSSTATDDRIRRRVGMVFQSFNLFPHMTALDNCMLAPLSVLGLSRAAARERALDYLLRVGLGDRHLRYPSQLSGGQQQRVAIARAMCMQPDILLMDEPTSALDPEMVTEVVNVMLDLASQGMTLLCVTHEMGFARRAANRLVFMDDARIVEDTTPERFFNAPGTERARQFLDKVLGHSCDAPTSARLPL